MTSNAHRTTAPGSPIETATAPPAPPPASAVEPETSPEPETPANAAVDIASAPTAPPPAAASAAPPAVAAPPPLVAAPPVNLAAAAAAKATSLGLGAPAIAAPPAPADPPATATPQSAAPPSAEAEPELFTLIEPAPIKVSSVRLPPPEQLAAPNGVAIELDFVNIPAPAPAPLNIAAPAPPPATAAQIPPVLPSPGTIASQAAAAASARTAPFVSPSVAKHEASAAPHEPATPERPNGEATDGASPLPPPTRPQPGHVSRLVSQIKDDPPAESPAAEAPSAPRGDVLEEHLVSASASRSRRLNDSSDARGCSSAWLMQQVSSIERHDGYAPNGYAPNGSSSHSRRSPPSVHHSDSPPPTAASLQRASLERRLAVYDHMEPPSGGISVAEQHALAELIKEATNAGISINPSAGVSTAAARRYLHIGKGYGTPASGLIPTHHPQLPPSHPCVNAEAMPSPSGLTHFHQPSPVARVTIAEPPSARSSAAYAPSASVQAASLALSSSDDAFSPPALANRSMQADEPPEPPWTCAPLAGGGGAARPSAPPAANPAMPPAATMEPSRMSFDEASPMAPSMPSSTAPAVAPPPPVSVPSEPVDAEAPDWLLVDEVAISEALPALEAAEAVHSAVIDQARHARDMHLANRATHILALVQQVHAALHEMHYAEQAAAKQHADPAERGAPAAAYAEAHIGHASALYIAAARARAASVSAAGELRARAAALRALVPVVLAGDDHNITSAGNADGEGEGPVYQLGPHEEANLTLLAVRAQLRRAEADACRDAQMRLHTMLAGASTPRSRDKAPGVLTSPFTVHVANAGGPPSGGDTPRGAAPSALPPPTSAAEREAAKEVEMAEREAARAEAEVRAKRQELTVPISEEAARLDAAAAAVSKTAHYAAAHLRAASSQGSMVLRALGFFACGVNECPLLAIPADLGRLLNGNGSGDDAAAVPIDIYFLCAQTLSAVGPPLTVPDGHAFLATGAPTLKLCLCAIEAMLLCGRPFDAARFVSVLQPAMVAGSPPARPTVLAALKLTHQQLDAFLVASASLLPRHEPGADGASPVQRGSPPSPTASLAASAPPEQLPTILAAAIAHVFPSVSHGAAGAAGAAKGPRLGRAQMLLSQELSAAGFVLLAEHARAQGTVMAGPWVRMIDLRGTTAWVSEPAADAWADDNCGHELQAVAPPAGGFGSGVGYAGGGAYAVGGGGGYYDDGANQVYVNPAEACHVLGNSLVAAGTRSALSVSQTTDEIIEAVRGPAVDAATTVSNVWHALTTSMAKFGEQFGDSMEEMQTKKSASAGRGYGASAAAIYSGGPPPLPHTTMRVSGAAPSGAPAGSEAETIARLSAELSRLRGEFEKSQSRPPSGGGAPATPADAAGGIGMPGRRPDDAGLPTHATLGAPSMATSCSASCAAVSSAGGGGAGAGRWPARMLELEQEDVHQPIAIMSLRV